MSGKGSDARPSEVLIPRTLSPTANTRRTRGDESPSGMRTPTKQNSFTGANKSKDQTNSIMDVSADSTRQPILSPASGHKDYQRYKYYSALRTGYAHLGIEEPKLEPPSHVVDNELFLFQFFSKCSEPWRTIKLSYLTFEDLDINLARLLYVCVK